MILHVQLCTGVGHQEFKFLASWRLDAHLRAMHGQRPCTGGPGGPDAWDVARAVLYAVRARI
eukprot:7664224-Lingulodinium_polyedra.AAC.1